MLRRARNRRFAVVLGMVFFIGHPSVGKCLDAGEEIKHTDHTNEDRSLECIDQVVGKRVIASQSVDPNWLLSPCPDSRAELLDTLSRDGLRFFDAGEFVYVIPSRFFAPFAPGASPVTPVKWSQIKIAVRIRPADGMDQQEADAVGKEVIEHARLIPLDPGYKVDGTALLQLNIYLYEAHLSPGSPLSIIAWVNQLPGAFAGRFVYGEMLGGKYVIDWDSPLFSDAGNPGFEDVNGDGVEEIVMQTHTCGNECSDLLSIFDKSGRELTRQDNCGDSRPGWVCDIEGADISLEDTPDGRAEIQVTSGSDGKDHVFKLVNGVYAPFPPFSKSVPLADKIAIADNDSGMKLMKESDYERAANAFVDAARMVSAGNDTMAALFANNAGFAYYKAKQYGDSVTWLKAAISDDPKRAIAYLNLGDALAKLNRDTEARQAYQKYLELAPDSKAASDVKKKLAAVPASP